MRPVTVALCQFRPSKGRPVDNLARIETLFHDIRLMTAPPDVMVLPEAILTGYFLEGGVREHARSAADLFAELAACHARAAAPVVDICVGFYELHEERLHNSALWATLGGDDAGIRHVHRKVFLPTYGVFDEERFVEAGHDVRAFDTRFGRAAMLVCEDAWHGLLPTIAAVDGAQLIAILAASPARGLTPDPTHPGRPGSLARWERLGREIAGEHGVFVALSQLVGFEGGKGFPGGSLLVGPDGDVVMQAPLFEDATVVHTLDLDTIVRVRAEAPLLSDLEVKLPHLIESLTRARQRSGQATEPNAAAAPRQPAATGSVQHSPAAAAPRLEIDPELTRRWLVEFLRDEVRRLRRFDHAILGLSGGVDSAVVAYLAAEALGPERVIAVRMPYRTSSTTSLDHARMVVEATGITERTVEISAAVDGYAAAAGIEVTPERLGNVMARMRMITLFDLSAALSALPIGTGNKSERLLGYFTWHADDTPPVNPIGDLFKTQVWALARHLGVPAEIVDKPATADLVHDQTDEGDFGITYARADGILDLTLRGYDAAAITAAGFTTDEQTRVRKRLDGTHWKRRLPSTAMLSGTAIGEYYLRPVDY
jgi:NAD+ synthase (glutamine-hydrolysing)